MREEFTYIIPGVPVNANQCNKINRKEWSDLAAELETKKHLLRNQHNDQPPLFGPINIRAIFYFPEGKLQKHRHYLRKPNTVFNLIRFVQKITEGVIIAPNAYIHTFESTIGYSYEPRTILIIERDIMR